MRIYVRRRENILKKFTDNVEKIQKELKDYLKKEKIKGKKIAAFGAAAKGMVLLYSCGFDSKIIDYIADGTPYKQGKYSPGTKIPVLPELELVKNTPDILLILAWNYKDEIIAKVNKMLSKTNKKITYVIPIPRVEILR